MERDLTSGSVLKNILTFSLPYLLSYFLQTLYGMADLFIIGRFGSVADITAVSIGSQLMHMLTVTIVGLAMGTTITIARSVGAKKNNEANLAIGNTVTLFLGISILLTAVLLMFVKQIVALMSTPTEAVAATTDYLTVCFLGIPFITAYNIIGSIFRGMGDSKSPMYFIAAACISNIVLDYIFMGYMNLGPLGAALGTTLSQTLSVIISLACIAQKNMGIHISLQDLKPVPTVMGQILKIGVPVSVQDGFIQISFIIITIIANNRGLNDAAAVGVVEKIIGVLFLIPSSMLSSVSALAAQNLGAHKPNRAKLTLRYAIAIAFGSGVLIAVAVQFLSEDIIRLFKNDPSVITLGSQYLRSYVIDCAIAGIHFCFSGYFCALEKSGISFLHNFLSIILARVPLSYIASAMFSETLFPMGCAAPIGSLLSVLICAVAYLILNKKYKNPAY